MVNFDDVTKENIEEHNPNWPNSWSSIQKINNWRLRIWKTSSFFNLTSHQPDTDKTYLYAKDQNETKFFLINKWKSTVLKHLNYNKAFIEFSNDMDDIYKNIEEYNQNKKLKTLIVFKWNDCWYG